MTAINIVEPTGVSVEQRGRETVLVVGAVEDGVQQADQEQAVAGAAPEDREEQVQQDASRRSSQKAAASGLR